MSKRKRVIGSRGKISFPTRCFSVSADTGASVASVACIDQPAVQALVLIGDRAPAEAAFGIRTARRAIDSAETSHSGAHLLDRVDDKACTSVIDAFRHAAAAKSNHRRAGQERLRQHDWKRLVPVN